MADELVTINGQAQGQLKHLVERIERLIEERDAVNTDLREIYSDAKVFGFSVPIIRKVVRLRKQDKAKVDEENALIDLYLSAIGGL